MADRLKLAVLISGRGTNMQALIDACAAADYPAEIVVVLSNEPDAAGLGRANEAGIEALVVPHRDFDGRESFEAAVTTALAERGVELIALAGFMRLLTESFVERWRDRLINIHPSLLPAFKGLDTHERALAAGVRFAGCTVHFVRTEMDSGPIIVQAAVPIAPDDHAASLAARVLEQEHVIYPFAVRLIAEGRVGIEDELVSVDGAAAALGATVSPTA